MHSIKTTQTFWSARLHRIAKRVALKSNDIERAVKWHVLGGRKKFSRNASDILRAHKWCFIVGCNNSGTSLLQDILDSSGLISTFPHEGQRYTSVLARAARRGHERVWSEFIHDLRLTAADSLANVPRLLHDWMAELSPPIKEIILEKTTANAVRLKWLQEVFPQSYFIGLVRNGYAVTEGISRKGGKSVERGARHWNLTNKIMLEDAKDVEHFLEIRYEDLVEKPLDVVQQVAELIGLDYEDLSQGIARQYSLDAIVDPLMKDIRNYNAESIARLTRDEVSNIYNEAAEMLDYFGYEANVA